MESGSDGRVTTGAADDQWQNITRRRTNAAILKEGRKERRRPLRRRLIFRKSLPTDRNEDSTPMMVADFVFRKQIEWLVENTGVRDDFKNGLERELGGNQQWHLVFPAADLTAFAQLLAPRIEAVVE